MSQTDTFNVLKYGKIDIDETLEILGRIIILTHQEVCGRANRPEDEWDDAISDYYEGLLFGRIEDYINMKLYYWFGDDESIDNFMGRLTNTKDYEKILEYVAVEQTIEAWEEHQRQQEEQE